MVSTKTSKTLLLTAVLASAGFMASAQAQQPAAPAANGTAAQADAAPAINVDAAAADAALRKRLQAITAALDGKTKLASNNFTEEFLKNRQIGNINSKDWLNSISIGLSYSFGRPPCYCD